MTPDPEDVLVDEFVEALEQAIDGAHNAFIERFREFGLDPHVVMFQVLAKLLGEYEGRLHVAEGAFSWIEDMRRCCMAEGLDEEIRFHAELCTEGDACAIMHRLKRARKRFDQAIEKVAERHRTSDALLEQMLDAFRPTTLPTQS